MRYKFPLILVYTADSTISGYDSGIDYLIKAIFLNNRLWPNTSKFIISLLFFFFKSFSIRYQRGVHNCRLRAKKGKSSTVEPRYTDTCLIRKSGYDGQFYLSRRRARTFSFTLGHLRRTPRLTRPAYIFL